jgi:hypothetical protein
MVESRVASRGCGIHPRRKLSNEQGQQGVQSIGEEHHLQGLIVMLDLDIAFLDLLVGRMFLDCVNGLFLTRKLYSIA